MGPLPGVALKPRILIVSQEFPPCVGGAGVVAWQNAAALAAAGLAVELLVVTPREGAPTPVPGVPIAEVPRPGKAWLGALAWRLRQLDLARFDAIVLNDTGAMLAFVLARLDPALAQRVVLFAHGREIETVLTRPSTGFRLVGARARYLDLVTRCRAVVTVSAALRDRLQAALPPGTRSDHVHAIHAGVDESLFSPGPSSVRASLGIERECCLLLTVSRIKEDKGFPRMVEIAAQLRARGMAFHWVIVGGGDYLAALRAQIDAHGLTAQVTLTGPMPRDALVAYYRAADLFWLLSPREAFGLVYVEAQACGTPVLAWRGEGGMGEALVPGITGALVDSDEAALEYLLEQRFREHDAAAMLAQARRFALSGQIAHLSKVLLAP